MNAKIKNSVRGKLSRINMQEMGMLFALAGLCVVLALLSPVFMTYDNIMNIIRQISITAIIAVGSFLVIVTGGIDLSVGPLAALTGVVTATFIISFGWPILLGILVGLIMGAAFGLVNGLMVTFGKLPPFIATLATMQIAKGLSFVISGGIPISGFPEGFGFIGRGHLGPFPWPVVFLFVIYIIMFDVIRRTKFGVYVFALGGNEQAAYLSGIQIKKNKLFVYMLGGLFAAIAGIILASRLNSGSPNVGANFVFDAVTAVVLGGTSMAGGEGKLSGVLIGSIFVGVLLNGMSLMNVDAYVQMVVQGVVLAGAMLLQTLGRKQK